MGSSGSGNFSDYSGKAKTSAGGNAAGGSSGSDKCGEAFHVGLEDVGAHQYFTNNGSVPSPGTELTIELRQRIVAVAGNLTVGSLPTSFNYLAGCLEAGFTYRGLVVASSGGASPQVQADFVAG